jgi:hypothetical protein
MIAISQTCARLGGSMPECGTALTEREMRSELVRQIDAAGGLVEWCRRTGLPHAPVSLVKNGHRENIPESIANACGFIVEKSYRRLQKDAAHGA